MNLSPDGRRIVFVDGAGSDQHVIVRALADGTERTRLRLDAARERVRWCDWAGSQYVVCEITMTSRTPAGIVERPQLHSFAAHGGASLQLWEDTSVPRERVIDLRASGAGRVLIERDVSGTGFPEVAELDVRTGQRHRVMRAHPPVRRWMSDGVGAVALGLTHDGARASVYTRAPNGEWVVRLEQSLLDAEAIGPLVAAGQHDLYALKHHHGRAALFHVDLGSSASHTLLFADAAFDVTGPVVLDPADRKLLAVQYAQERERVVALHPEERLRYEWIDERLPSRVNRIIDRSDDGRVLLVRSSADVDPPSLYLFDTRAQSVQLVGHEYPRVEDRSLAPMRSLTYAARDGQSIPAYLTLPSATARAVPAIVLPHGGPESRWVWGFDPLTQYLASRGFAVLQMNYRGSIGYGVGYAAAGAGQWGGVIHNDITDAARWLIQQRIADPERICILGQSFGGYAALLGAARESQWYACAISYAGISDLLAFAQYTERMFGRELSRLRLASTPRGLWGMSPIAQVHAVETPVLLIHGRRDAVVPVSQSQRFARALRNAGKPHELIVSEHCDHDMENDACRQLFFVRIGAFLRQVLGTSH